MSRCWVVFNCRVIRGNKDIVFMVMQHELCRRESNCVCLAVVVIVPVTWSLHAISQLAYDELGYTVYTMGGKENMKECYTTRKKPMQAD